MRLELKKFALLLLVACAAGRAELGSPTAQDQQAAIEFSKAVESEHFLEVPLSTVSYRIHANYLASLDPDSIYLTEQDKVEFLKYEARHGDEIKAGKFSSAWDMFHRLLQRKREKIPPVVELLEKGEAPTGNSSLEKFVREDLEIRVKSGMPRAEAIKILRDDLKRGLEWTTKASTGQVTEVYLDSAAIALDPHSSYMSEDTYEGWKMAINSGFDGIGVTIAPGKGGIEIKSVMPGGGAAKEGTLQAGHRIVGASEDGVNYVDFDKVPYEKASQLLKGAAGTTVYLKVSSQEGVPPNIIQVPREHISLGEDRVKIHIAELPIEGEALPIAIIDIPSYYSDPDHKVSMAKDVYKAIESLAVSGKGVAGIIIDQRGNGGGSIDEVVHLIGLLHGKVPAVQVTDFAGDKIGNAYVSQLNQIYNGPLVVLVDKRSASSSEILAGAVQDYGRGIIVGDSRTFGKGSVQQVYVLEGEKLGVAKLTVQGFFRPKGKTTQHGGVESDVVFSSGWDQAKVGEHSLPNPLQFEDITPVVNVGKSTHVTPEFLKALRDRHAARVSADPVLAALNSQIADFLKLSATVSSSGTSLPGEELSKLGAMGKQELSTGTNLTFGNDPYTREVLHILGDYAVILNESGLEGTAPEVAIVDPPNGERRELFAKNDCPYSGVAVRVIRPRPRADR